MANTKIIIASTGQEFNLPGTRTAAQIVADFADSVAGIGNMQADTKVEGELTTITFSARTGTKGAASTKVVIASTGQEYNLPGTRTAAQVVADFSDSVSGISNMQSDVKVEGELTTITFSARTGTKG